MEAVSALLRMLPWRVRRAYRKRRQCPAMRPHQRSGGLICCVRDRHADEWHRDGWGMQWRDGTEMAA